MIESITSYLFGKFADFTFSSLMTKLDIKDKEDKKKIEKAIKDFKKYLTDRHIENPYYEDVISLWEKYQVCEELIKICYKLDSKFKTCQEFKEYLSEKFEGRIHVKELSNNLMDELEKYLSDTVSKASNFTQADIAVVYNVITKPIINAIPKLSENNASLTQSAPENNKTTQQLEQEKTKSLSLNSDFNAETEVDIIKRILQEYFPIIDGSIINYKTLQEFFSNGYKDYYPVKKKEQHFTFDEKFTAIEQHYNGVDKLYAIIEFIKDLYSEIKSQHRFVRFYLTSEKFKQQEESGEYGDETENWKETIKHISLADQCEELCKRVRYSLGETNHVLVKLDRGKQIIIEKNVYASEVSKILSETSIQDAILEYNHFANKGNIQRKREIIISLAGYLEPFRDELNASEELKEVMKVKNKKIIAVSKLFDMYNNLGLRHNNSDQYHLEMTEEELEKWYDNVYTSTLFIILSLDEARILSKWKTLGNWNKIVVEENIYVAKVSQIVSETSIQDAIKVLEYNHYKNKENIQDTKEILVSLAGYLEPLKDELNASEELKEVMKVKNNKIIAVEQFFNMYNNLGLRHNNSKQYHLEMAEEELEQWYDDIYTSTLFVILSLDEARILSRFNKLKLSNQK